jgi:hypothetical protein
MNVTIATGVSSLDFIRAGNTRNDEWNLGA